MLSANQMVKIRKAKERLYNDKVIFQYQTNTINKETGIVERNNESIGPFPCRLSHKTFGVSNNAVGIAENLVEVKLFLAPEVVVPEGSTAIVTHYGKKYKYKLASTRAIYSTHQEINLNRGEYNGKMRVESSL